MKRRMWMLAFSAAMVMALGVFAQGQEGGGPPQGGQRRGPMMSPDEQVNRLSEELKLTDEQKPKIKAIYQEQMEKGAKLREDTSLSQEDRRAKMMEMRKETNDKIKAVLDKDQQKKFDEMQERMRQRGPGGPGGPGGGQRPPQ